MIHTETERKFLILSDAFKAQATESHRIKQGYIARDNGNSVRVRIKDSTGILTIKGPSADDISRTEWEIEIPLADAEALLKLCHGGIIDKTRYIVPEGGTLSQTPGHPRPGKREGPADEGGGRGRSEAEAIAGSVSPSVNLFHLFGLDSSTKWR